MKHYLLIFSGLLVLGIAVVLLLYYRHCPHVFRRLSRAALHLKYSPSSDITFRSDGIQGYNSHGPRGSTFDSAGHRSSDCVTVGRTIYRFPTTEDAEAQFSDWIQSAVKVLKTEEDSS